MFMHSCLCPFVLENSSFVPVEWRLDLSELEGEGAGGELESALSFLHAPYKRRNAWWQFVVMAEKLALTGFAMGLHLPKKDEPVRKTQSGQSPSMPQRKLLPSAFRLPMPCAFLRRR